MKAGDVVEIYFDPISQTKVEGKARLLRKSECDPGRADQEFWEIQFLDDVNEPFCERWIATNPA